MCDLGLWFSELYHTCVWLIFYFFKANADSIEKFAKCIRKLRFPYDYSNFKNPALQKVWHQIEAIALDIEKPEEFDDLTTPDTDRHEERAGELLKEFANSVGLTSDSLSKSKRKVVNRNKIFKLYLILRSIVRQLKIVVLQVKNPNQLKVWTLKLMQNLEK